jgi:DNA polymerase III delta prime subunit
MSELEQCKPATCIEQDKSYLFYGPPGTGKTTLAMQHKKPKPKRGNKKLVLDVDNKLHEMENLEPKILENIAVWSCNELLLPGGIEYITVDPKRKDPTLGKSQGPKPRGFLRQVEITNELLRLADKGEYPYDCTILDSGTRTVDHLIALVLWTHGHGSMTETLWGVFGQNFNNYLQGFLRLPGDKIVIFHERHVTKRDKEGNVYEEFTRPSCPGQQGLNLGSYFSEAYYFKGRSVTDEKYYIQTGADTVVYARTTKGLGYKQVIDPARIYGV